MSEMERMARLRDQESRGDDLPSSLHDLVDVDGRLLVEQAEEAKRRWLVAREEICRASSFSASERLFSLTVLLVPRGKPRQRRAVLETAIELVSDEGHRHILRCLLARYAVGAGEPDAAEAWLALCNPRPLDLRMDTAYRLAAATLATARRDHDAVLAILGEDTPLADAHALDCTLLQIHALEARGGGERAVALLEELEAREGDSDRLEQAFRLAIPEGLCLHVRRKVSRRQKKRRLVEVEEVLSPPPELRGLSGIRKLGVKVWTFLRISLLLSAVSSVLAVLAAFMVRPSNEATGIMLVAAVAAGPLLTMSLLPYAHFVRKRQLSAAREQHVHLTKEIGASESALEQER